MDPEAAAKHDTYRETKVKYLFLFHLFISELPEIKLSKEENGTLWKAISSSVVHHLPDADRDNEIERYT